MSNSSPLHSEGRGWVFLFLCLLLFLLMPVACGEGSGGPTAEEVARRDSAAFHVAVMPVADCLPLHFAQRTGMFDSLGVDVRLHTLTSQLDIDTALLRGHVMLAYSDLIRAIVIQQADTCPVVAVAAVDGDLALVTPRRGRVRTIPQLRERMVAVARHSITDYWSDRLTDTASMERDAIFRPQINAVGVRTAMLINGTMDAAFLPEPYATQMTLLGAKCHLSTHQLQPRLAAFVAAAPAMTDTARRRQLALCLRAYDLAAARLNADGRDSLPSMLRQLCHVPDSLADSLATLLPPFARLDSVRRADADAALRWLQQRGRSRDGYTPDTLISNITPPTY